MQKIILITGASSGIGSAAAKLLLGEGHVIYGAARRLEKMADLKEAGVHTLKMDLTDDPSIVTGVNQVIKEQGRIDVLINNAGYGSFGSLEDTRIAEAKRQFEVNLFGLGRLTQLVLPHMRNQKSGKVINIASTGGKYATPFGGWYQSTKFALEGLSDALRMDVKKFGIDVVVVEPGAIASEWDSIAMDHLIKQSSEPYAEYARNLAESFGKQYKNASDPIVIARVITKAVKAKKPKTRYTAGHLAALTLFLRKILSDRQMDNLFLNMTGTK